MFRAVLVLTLLSSALAGKDVDCMKIPKTPLNTTCCNAPEVIESDIIEVCEEDIKRHSYSEIMHECMVVKCVCEKSGFYDGDTISIGKVLTHLAKTKTGQHPKWGPLITQTMKTCVGNTENRVDRIRKIFALPPFNVDPKVCDTVPIYVANCIDAHVLTTCPEDSWNGGEPGCNEWRTYLRSCDLFEEIATIEVSQTGHML